MRNALALALAGALAACAMPESQRAELDPANTAVAAGQGLVVARLVTNTTSAPIVLGNATLNLADVNGVFTSYALRNKAAPNASSALFIQSLPPGRYQPKSLVSAAGNMTLTAPLEKLAQAFDVEADRVTDLGALVMSFDSVGPFGGKYRMAHLASPDDSGAALEALPSELARRLASRPPLRAGGPVNAMANNAILRQALSLASVTSFSPPVEGKPMLFGRTLGVVSLWDAENQQWTHLHTGRSFGVRSAAIANDGTLLVGMDEGVLLARNREAWQTLPPPVKNATVLFIGQSQAGEYFVVAEDRASFIALTSVSPAGPWKELRRIPAGRFLNPAFNSRVQVALTPSRLAITFWPGGTENHVLHTFNLATRAWESTPLPFDAAYTFSVPADGHLVTSGGTAFNPALHWSTDWGKSFKRIALENWSALPVFRDSRTIYLRRTEKIGMFSAAESITLLLRSLNGGETWEQMGELPKFMNQLYVLPRPGWLLATTAIGDMHVSRDDGRTWTREPPSPPSLRAASF